MDIYKLGKDTDIFWLEGNLIHVPKNVNFNFGYILYIPNNIIENPTMIIEGSNSRMATDDVKEADEIMLKEGLVPSTPIFDIGNELGLPILFPLFPRIYNGEETIFNHMLSSNSLDSNTHKIKELGLERVDLQLIEMFKDAKELLKVNGINISEQFIINGFSASSKFANRFTILHPEYIKMCIAGGVTGVLTLPIESLNNEKLLWPVGIGNLEELIGEHLTNEQINNFKNIKQIYYMGEEDINNNPYAFDENNESKYKGIIKTEELKQLNNIFGSDIKSRWIKTQKLYNELGINCEFITYPGFGHDPRCATNDIKERIKKQINIAKERK